MSGLLKAISEAIRSDATTEKCTLFEEVFAAISARLQQNGVLQFEVRGDGALVSDQSVLPATDNKFCLGTTLKRAGVSVLCFRAGLTPAELSAFFSAVALRGVNATHDQHDLVTWWFEKGADTIELKGIELPSAVAGSLPEVELMTAVTGGPTSRHPEFGRSISQLMSGPDILPISCPEPLMKSDLGSWAQQLHGETTERAQRQVINSLLAALSARTPALSGNELALLLRRVLIRELETGRFEQVMGTIRHLEALTLEDAYVSRAIRDRSKAVLRKLRSPHMLDRIVRSFANRSKPNISARPILTWLIQESPLTMWNAVVPRLDPDLVGFAAIAFSLVLEFGSPFWNEAVRSLNPEQRKVVKRSLSQLSDTLFDLDGEAAPPLSVDTAPLGSPGIRPDTSAGVQAIKKTKDDSWADFENLDWMEESSVDELDPSIIEFLRERSRAGTLDDD